MPIDFLKQLDSDYEEFEEDKVYRQYMVKDLIAGLVLKADIKTSDGRLVLAKDSILDFSDISKIRNFAKKFKINEPISCDYQ